MIILEKESKIQLSKNLSHDEFKCQCNNCEATLINPKLVVAFQKLRDLIGHSLHVNCGYRCQQHNREIRKQGFKSASRSRHQTGDAIDVSTKNVTQYTQDEFIELAKKCGFTFALKYETFVHLDTRGE